MENTLVLVIQLIREKAQGQVKLDYSLNGFGGTEDTC